MPSAVTTCGSRPLFTKVTLPDNPVTVPPIVVEGALVLEPLHPLIVNAMAPQARIDCNTRILIFIGAPIDCPLLALPSGGRRRSVGSDCYERGAGIMSCCLMGRCDAPHLSPGRMPTERTFSRTLNPGRCLSCWRTPTTELSSLARMALQRAQMQWAELDCHIAWCDECILAHVRSDDQAKAAMQLCGIGPVTASALVAGVGDFKQFKTGAQLSSWLGVVPSQMP